MPNLITPSFNPAVISPYRRLTQFEKYDLECYAYAVQFRDDGVPLRAAQRRLVKTYSPPYWPDDIKNCVKDAYRGVAR